MSVKTFDRPWKIGKKCSWMQFSTWEKSRKQAKKKAFTGTFDFHRKKKRWIGEGVWQCFFWGRETQNLSREKSSIFASVMNLCPWENMKNPSKIRVKIILCLWNFLQITHVKKKKWWEWKKKINSSLRSDAQNFFLANREKNWE